MIAPGGFSILAHHSEEVNRGQFDVGLSGSLNHVGAWDILGRDGSTFFEKQDGGRK
jgi:hypothetical protein